MHMDYLDSIIKAFLGALGGGIFALIMFFIKIELRKIKVFKAEHDAIIKSLKSLSHDSLFRCCRDLRDKDEITEYERENLDHLYVGYSALGLNGTGKKLYEENASKPTTRE